MKDVQMAVLLTRLLKSKCSIGMQEVLDSFIDLNDCSLAWRYIRAWILDNFELSELLQVDMTDPFAGVWIAPILNHLLDNLEDFDHVHSLNDTVEMLKKCLISVSDALSAKGLHSLAVPFEVLAMATCKEGVLPYSQSRMDNLCAMSLLEQPIELLSSRPHIDIYEHSLPRYRDYIGNLKKNGILLSEEAIIQNIESTYASISHGELMLDTEKQSNVSRLARLSSLDTVQSLGSINFKRKNFIEERQGSLASPASKPELHADTEEQSSDLIYPKGVEIFKVDGENIHSICSCPLLAPDVCGRLIAVATHKHGILEFATHPDIQPLPVRSMNALSCDFYAKLINT